MPFRMFPVGAKPTQEPPRIERRAKVRSACNREAFCQPIAEEDLWWQATVCDISCDGVGLVSTRRLQPGTHVVIELEGLTHSRQARVIHATRPAEGGWLVGCQFMNQLSEEQLQVLREAE